VDRRYWHWFEAGVEIGYRIGCFGIEFGIVVGTVVAAGIAGIGIVDEFDLEEVVGVVDDAVGIAAAVAGVDFDTCAEAEVVGKQLDTATAPALQKRDWSVIQTTGSVLVVAA
jgi:hypothetical protein